MTNDCMKPSRRIQQARQRIAEKSAEYQRQRQSYDMQRPSVWIAYVRKVWECENVAEVAPLVTQHIDDKWASPLVASMNWASNKLTAIMSLVPDDVKQKLYDYHYPKEQA